MPSFRSALHSKPLISALLSGGSYPWLISSLDAKSYLSFEQLALSLVPVTGFRLGSSGSYFHHDGLQSGFKRSCASEPPHSHEDDEALSPLDWTTGQQSLLASPFSEDIDSDDDLAPSPFSSPESTTKPETRNRQMSLFSTFGPRAQGRGPGYQHLRQYPSLALFSMYKPLSAPVDSWPIDADL